MFNLTEDGSVLDDAGRVLHFSVSRFTSDIGEGECCFVCGIDRSAAPFNDEHVIPRWILRKFDLFSQTISLPNRATLSYGSYTVPCCASCNSRMSAEIETPISQLVARGFEAVRKYVESEGPEKLFTWLNLIFLKTHLKDRKVRFHQDARQGAEKISDLYEWRELHHIHCVARSFYTGAKLDASAIGTMMVVGTKADGFDYGDCYLPRTVMLRLGEVGFVAVLNDSRIVAHILQPMLAKIGGQLSPAQLREVMLRMAFTNFSLQERPQGNSWFGYKGGRPIIMCDRPTRIVLPDKDEPEFGLKVLEINPNAFAGLGAAVREAIVKRHAQSFLFDRNGNFVRDPLC